MPRKSTKLPPVTIDTPPLPDAAIEREALPEEQIKRDALPPEYNPENCIEVNGERIEIHPTKLKYQRDGTAGFYKALQIMPLIYIFQQDDKYFDEKRTPTKCVMDWVTAATDNPDWVKRNFDDIDTETFDRLYSIFMRLNKFDEKEEEIKNRMAAVTKA